MAAYEAVVTLKHALSILKDNTGLWMSKYHPSLMEIFQFLFKELKSSQKFVERLDMRSRMRMKVPLRRIVEAVNEFQDMVHSSDMDTILNQPEVMLDESDKDLYTSFYTEWEETVDLDQVYRAMQNLRQMAHSVVDALKKAEEDHLDHDDEAHVDSSGQIVGLSDVYDELKRSIISTEVHNHVVSLVGMTGIGKTTLAKKLYQDLDVLEWFDYCAWVTVGINFQPEKITETIRAEMDLNDDPDKRCLIVLDDVWDLELCSSYIDTLGLHKGIKVLLTTRIQDDCDLSYLLIKSRLLDKQESWNLLCDKVFAQNSCPLELEKAGKMIAEKCDGLPLTIITVANLLSKIPESLWIQVATQKKHQVFIDAYDEISELLYPCYANLRNDLKFCFLYMGVFPQYSKIPKSKLINLWIVEKIIEKNSFQTLELSGVEVLHSLALHSFVMVYQRSTIMFDDRNERIKNCGLHSSWWNFCYREARKNNFFHILDSYTDASEKLLKSQSRLTVHNNVLFGIKVVHKSMEENCAFTTHSLLCLGPYHQYPLSTCFGLKLLKKLDALQIRFYQFPLEVLELVKLRYLALTCHSSLPHSISKLLKLQYLIVHQHLSMKYKHLSYLPVEIWDMKELKHLDITGSDLPDVGDVDGTLLPNLFSLSDVSFNSCNDGVIKRMPNLKKLGIRIVLLPNEVEPSYCFDHISHLDTLESLKCVIVNPTSNVKGVAPLVGLSMFSLSLKKLYLSGLGYPWKEVSTISALPNLEVLKLRNNAFQGPKWVVEDFAFPMLHCLIMEDLDLTILTGGHGCFKGLEKISIKHCYNLKTFRLRQDYELVTNSSEVIDCNPLVGREIQKSIVNEGHIPKYFSLHSSWNS